MSNNRKEQAFQGVAESYDKARPSYPKEIFVSIVNFWRENHPDSNKKPKIADIGCGTGISTRAFNNAFPGEIEIIGIEPGKDMLKIARESSPLEISYIESPAEKIPLEDNSLDIITVAQAALWFDQPIFYQEANRILKENGVIAIFENNRNWENSKFLENHEIFLETYSIDPETQKKYSRNYRNYPYEKELSEIFSTVYAETFFWSKKMSPEDFLKMAKTSTQVRKIIVAIGESKTDELILNNAKQYVSGKDNLLDMFYNTKLYMAKK